MGCPARMGGFRQPKPIALKARIGRKNGLDEVVSAALTMACDHGQGIGN